MAKEEKYESISHGSQSYNCARARGDLRIKLNLAHMVNDIARLMMMSKPEYQKRCA
jgi:hypothetical protein